MAFEPKACSPHVRRSLEAWPGKKRVGSSSVSSSTPRVSWSLPGPTPGPSLPLGSSLSCPMMAVTVDKQPPVPKPGNELPVSPEVPCEDKQRVLGKEQASEYRICLQTLPHLEILPISMNQRHDGSGNISQTVKCSAEVRALFQGPPLLAQPGSGHLSPPHMPSTPLTGQQS